MDVYGQKSSGKSVPWQVRTTVKHSLFSLFCNMWSVSFIHENQIIVPIPSPALNNELAFKLEKKHTLFFHICYFSSEL